MKRYLESPDVQLRAIEWGFGAAVVALVVCALAFGWIGAVLDGFVNWYSGVFTASFEVQDVYVAPASVMEPYVPGESRSTS